MKTLTEEEVVANLKALGDAYCTHCGSLGTLGEGCRTCLYCGNADCDGEPSGAGPWSKRHTIDPCPGTYSTYDRNAWKSVNLG